MCLRSPERAWATKHVEMWPAFPCSNAVHVRLMALMASLPMLQLSCWNMLEHEATSHEALPEDDGALGESMEDTTGAACEAASIGTHIARRCFTSLSLFLDVLSKPFLTVFLLKTFATFHFSVIINHSILFQTFELSVRWDSGCGNVRP